MPVITLMLKWVAIFAYSSLTLLVTNKTYPPH